MASSGKCRFSIDRGGTFTDVYAETPQGVKVMKLLSVDPANYSDAPREGIRRILDEVYGTSSPKDAVPTENIEWIRMGTTVATNALLERKGAPTALAITSGFHDLLKIGTQARPKIFDLSVVMPELLYSKVVEIEERVRLVHHAEDEAHDGKPYITGASGELVEVLQEPDEAQVRRAVQEVYDAGVRSLAVVLMHSYTYDKHELLVKRVAEEVGMTLVSISSELMPMIKIVPRGLTTCVDAYLTPLIVDYINGFKSGFAGHLEGVSVSFMQSDGGLTDANKFHGFRAILSGPAGGVVGYSQTTYDAETGSPVIGFDMGGTSTDVSRFGGEYEHVFETNCAGVIVQAPQLDITTVAAGGGSICAFKQDRFCVGPESAGAHPGPVCYRKNGKLAVTDANLVLGRIIPDFFPKIFGKEENMPLDSEASLREFEKVTEAVNRSSATRKTPEEVAYGFITVANEAMCRPIRSLTEAKGYSTSDHVLSCFGGAGGQHACAIARSLGMSSVFVHRYSGILSAYGIGLADVVVDEQLPAQQSYTDGCEDISRRVASLRQTVVDKLKAQGFVDSQIQTDDFLNLRYDRTGTSFMIRRPDAPQTFTQAFEENYHREYGFIFQDRGLILDDIRVRGTGKGIPLGKHKIQVSKGAPEALRVHRAYFEGGWRDTPVFRLEGLGAGDSIPGPAIVMQGGSTVIVEPECTALITEFGDIRITVGVSAFKITRQLDPISLSIFSHRFMSIAEQMGRALQRTSISTNIKERLDFSCAIFGPDGGLVANAPHIPVHLGAMGATVREQKAIQGANWKEGDVMVTNHPAVGGSHLPDITVITPVFSGGEAVFYVACRGHHADIGGTTPGSIPPFSKRLVEEGAHIKSFKLVSGGVFQEQGITDLLMAPGKVETLPGEPAMSGTRALPDNLADLQAQVAANQKGIKLMSELITQYGLDVVQAYMGYVQDNAARAVEQLLRDVAASEGAELVASDFMDDGTQIKLNVTIDASEPSAVFDFTGTDPQVYANHNCPSAVVSSAIIYCLRCLVNEDIPLNQGCMNPIKVVIPPNTVLSPDESCAVVGGNVLTSQRVTDIVLQAFNACADSQGDTNNLTFGDDSFGYYETIAGGAGAGPRWVGTSGVHTHMTNTRITDAEILERRYPVLLNRFHLRDGSGGEGHFPGGEGVHRELIFLKDLTVGILSERRAIAPNGRGGGGHGQRGKNTVVRAPVERDASIKEIWSRRTEGAKLNFGGKNAMNVRKGDRLVIATPGGGGWGSAAQ
eukprot:TRINITY_DN31991_c0_g1_i1.p1 TRINITY_DN31991_c0_g1~~TRINITY_DN31991_c0_g1_i1.p1  ORF type:complete len:1259 (+),score=475.10 TRINITY_DN31991_c0_g1_i1:98-3874(+)